MNIPFDMKTPVFIDRNHKLAELIANYCHSMVLQELNKPSEGRNVIKSYFNHVLFVKV